MSDDPKQTPDPPAETTAESAEEDAASREEVVNNVAADAAESQPAETSDVQAAAGATSVRRRIKIGSQRDDDNTADVLKARPQNVTSRDAAGTEPGRPGQTATGETTADQVAGPVTDDTTAPPAASPSFPPPRLESKHSPELEDEIQAALGEASIDELLKGSAAETDDLEEGAQVDGQVLSVRDDVVIVELGRRHQGLVATKQFEQPPEVGTPLKVAVREFDAEEGIYQLVLPDAAADVSGWDELTEGMVVQATVTGHNKGGLECEVSKLRGFIPASQVALYRIENLEELVGQRFDCVVTEVKPERRNLVLSRRAILERERAEAKKKLMDELEVGQVREGVVTRLQPFGAFVDLGGIDGLLHISQLSWDRIADPGEVLEVGQKVRVKINKIAKDTGKIGLAYRDLWENPWIKVPEKYKPKTQVRGTVSKLMDFGAFVRLEPGVEGLIHVSELAHRRVWRPSDVVSEGQEVDVMVLSVDTDKQRIGLSLKALQQPPAKKAGKKDEGAESETDVPDSPRKSQSDQSLKGGTNRNAGGEQFGLKW